MYGLNSASFQREKKLDHVYLQSTAHNQGYLSLSISASSYLAFSPHRVTIKGNAYEENIMLVSKRKKSVNHNIFLPRAMHGLS
jgi:hypothetical protein